MRSELVAALQRRRDNDVLIVVPLESGGDVRLEVTGVGYCEVTDRITVTTQTFFDLPEGGGQ